MSDEIKTVHHYSSKTPCVLLSYDVSTGGEDVKEMLTGFLYNYQDRFTADNSTIHIPGYVLIKPDAEDIQESVKELQDVISLLNETEEYQNKKILILRCFSVKFYEACGIQGMPHNDM